MLRAREITAIELLDACLAQHETHNGKLNAIVVMQVERARADAEAADAAAARGEWLGPLHGLPVTVKECIDWTGTPSTWGDPRHVGYEPAEDAQVVVQLRRAGAVLYGKTNVPIHLGAWQTYNAIHGRTNNPWNVDRSAGGSSGGSAVSAATGMASIEMGSDIGGSIRWPANYNGVAGLKPSFGLVSAHGHSFPGHEGEVDNNVVGPIARTVADLELVLPVISQPYIFLPEPVQASLSDFRVGVLLDNPIGAQSTEVAAIHRRTVDTLRDAGMAVVDPPPADFLAAAHEVGLELVRAASAGPGDAPTIEELQRFDDGARDYDALAAQAHRVTHRAWIDLDNERERVRLRLRDYFAEVDVLLTPVTPTTAPPHDTERPFNERTVNVDGVERSIMEQWFWAGLANPTYLPAVAFPVAVAPDGLPVGMQAIGPFMGDRTALRFAALAQELLGHPLDELHARL
jgi:amidase